MCFLLYTTYITFVRACVRLCVRARARACARLIEVVDSIKPPPLLLLLLLLLFSFYDLFAIMIELSAAATVVV